MEELRGFRWNYQHASQPGDSQDLSDYSLVDKALSATKNYEDLHDLANLIQWSKDVNEIGSVTP